MLAETVAEESSVPVPQSGPGRLPTNGGRIHEGMCWGAAALEKNGSTTSKNMTATTESPKPLASPKTQ